MTILLQLLTFIISNKRIQVFCVWQSKNIYQPTKDNSKEGLNLHKHWCENLESHIFLKMWHLWKNADIKFVFILPQNFIFKHVYYETYLESYI
jgi:hypothetical protein